MSQRILDFMSPSTKSLRGYSWVDILNFISSLVSIMGMRRVHMEFDQILTQINGCSKELVTDSRYTRITFKAGQILAPNPKLNESLSLGGSQYET